VTDRREGRWMYYTLNAEKLADVADLAQTLATPLPARADGCC
jgi:DNA-binding transcriptional ArsR family regulator